jgi:hypothetical protein
VGEKGNQGFPTPEKKVPYESGRVCPTPEKKVPHDSGKHRDCRHPQQ